MKKAVSFCLFLLLLLSCRSGAAFADNTLAGSWGGQEPIHNGLSSVFYLNEKVKDCTKLSMTLSIGDYSGWPFGNWYLYAKDLKDNWDHIADFKLDKSFADGHSETFSFSFKQPKSFKALALCMRDKGNTYSLTWDELSFSLGSAGYTAPAAKPTPTPAPKKNGVTRLAGSWGEREPIKNGNYAPYYLKERMRDCTDLTMELSIVDYTGYPFGDWYLYAKDLKGNWNHISEFRIEKSQAAGGTATYDFHFKQPQSFQALAICVRDKGAEFSLTWDISFYA